MAHIFHFCKGLIDAVWCDNVGSQMHSNSANMLYIYQGRYVVFVVIGFWFLYDLYKFYLWAFKVPQEAVLIKDNQYGIVK